MTNDAKEQIAGLSAKFDEIKRRKFSGADAITVSIRQKEEFPIQQVIGQLGIVPVNASDAATLSALLAALNSKLTQTNAAGSEPEFLEKLRQAAGVARESKTGKRPPESLMPGIGPSVPKWSDV